MSGAGKSTQAHLLSRAYGFTRIGAGEQLRELATQGEAPIHRQIELLLLKGYLMPDEIVVPIMIDPIKAACDTSAGFILDGTPRNLKQAELLDTSLQEMGMCNIRVIYFHILLDQLRERVAQRLVCKNCQAPSGYPGSRSKCDFCGGMLAPRMDDTADVVDKRWREYIKQTEPLIQAYDRQGKLICINAERPIHIVFAEIINALHSVDT